MGLFPFEWQVGDLSAVDFIQFNTQFSQTLLQLIPFAEGPVTFIDSMRDHDESLQEINKPKYWKQHIKRVVKRQLSSVAAERRILFLPVWSNGGIIAIAAVEGIDEQFADSLSGEWLDDRSRIISREFFLYKQSAHDPATGMLNGRHLNKTLEGFLLEVQAVPEEKRKNRDIFSLFKDISMLLIEIHPRANNAEKALNYIVRAGYYFESCLGQDVLHHLGNGIFGLIVKGLDEDQAQKLGKNILSWSRREGFQRIHIGINTIENPSPHGSNETPQLPGPFSVMTGTWAALRKARRRGPYALCTYSSISKPDAHPLKKTKPRVLAKLRKSWTDADRFTIVLISQDRVVQDMVFPKRLLALIEPGAEAIPINESEIFVFLKGADEKKALSWARALKKKLSADLGATYSIGIAGFPCVDFRKPDILQNARKALLHAGFFGPGTLMVFDGVSQNVSGDIYYGEGNLVQAIKEYRKGLEMDPANSNLLNSLGEAYAQMNKPKKAREFFEAILGAEPRHYMALFNLGVTYLTTGEDEEAIGYFEQALATFRRKPDTNKKNDLLLQLSKLYCQTGRYIKTVALLEKEKIRDQAGSMTPDRNALLRYLGEAYLESGRNKEAVAVLQHAIRYNPHDSFALSMLGALYALENQGDDIALSLCLQAVNIDDRPWKHWYRLALVKYRMADYESALDALKESLRRERKREEPLYLAGQVYNKLGFPSKAAAMFESVLKITPTHKAAGTALKKIKSN